ncbi:MAG: outer membrane beta-barrel protein [Ignavibacteriales bacterium]|nr:outer membrane beta-barrel protein [Ignavibacteriales bacterium]
MKYSNFTGTECIMKLIIRLFQYSVFIITLTALTSTYTCAQVNIKLGGGFGVMSPAADFGGSTIEYYNGSRYGLSGGLNIHGKAKIGFFGFNLAGEIDYSSLSNTGNSEPGQGQVDISQKIVSLKIGPEFRLSLPVLPVTPYLGLNVALNSFSGETTFQGVSKVPSATYSVQSATRFGVGFYAGTEVSIGPFLSLDFNLSYNLMNLFGKQWNDVNPGVNQRIDSYLSLNDQSDPLYAAGDDKHFVSNSRSISSILFTVSILFGL